MNYQDIKQILLSFLCFGLPVKLIEESDWTSRNGFNVNLWIIVEKVVMCPWTITNFNLKKVCIQNKIYILCYVFLGLNLLNALISRMYKIR